MYAGTYNLYIPIHISTHYSIANDVQWMQSMPVRQVRCYRGQLSQRFHQGFYIASVGKRSKQSLANPNRGRRPTNQIHKFKKLKQFNAFRCQHFLKGQIIKTYDTYNLNRSSHFEIITKILQFLFPIDIEYRFTDKTNSCTHCQRVLPNFLTLSQLIKIASYMIAYSYRIPCDYALKIPNYVSNDFSLDHKIKPGI